MTIVKSNFSSKTLSFPVNSCHNTVMNNSQVFQKNHSKACSLMGKKKYAQAIPYLLAALEEIPHHPVVYSNLATSYYESGNPEEAFRIVSEARSRGIKTAEIDNVSGLIELKRQQYTKALESFYEAVKKEPKIAVYHNHLGVALFKLKKYPHAFNEFKTAVTLDPSNKEALRNLHDCEDFI